MLPTVEPPRPPDPIAPAVGAVCPHDSAIHARRTASMLRQPRRLLLAAAGLLSVGLAAVGVVVPGMPTTVFLIAASYCFARSCPWLEERLLRARFFAPYMEAVAGRCPIPPRARWTALFAMWGSIVFSLGVLRVGDTLTHALTAVILVAGLAGTIAIVRYRRGPSDMGPA